MPSSPYTHTIGSKAFQFSDLKDLLAKASPLKSGDCLAGVAAESEAQRVAARFLLADLPLADFLNDTVIPYEEDEVTRLIMDTHDAEAFAPLSSMTVGEFRDWLLAYDTTAKELSRVSPGITPEMAAAVSKLMRNQDLILTAHKIETISRFRSTIGLKGHLSSRLQPNHPTDDPKGIVAAIIDGLLNGIGDAVIGINPVTDDIPGTSELLILLDDIRRRYHMPVQSCILTHVTNTLAIIEQKGPVDIVFQSIAGTEGANTGFGITLALLQEARDAALSLKRGTIGNQVMYFETGQGSALSADAHHGVDQQTLEARTYAVARQYDPLLVNTVVGFIGPEYLYDGTQIIRAGLEDHFCGKLLGLPMGCDICYTNHAQADQNDMDNLLTLLGAAGVNFIMGVPGADDVMLNYQSTSFHDTNYLRQVMGLKCAPEFESWLKAMGIIDDKQRLVSNAAPPRLLSYLKEI